ncbi:MAG: two-component system response regulator [Verrucomicrobiales bacterium]|nr:two-component system response regulator [Verrucomicrobiales bacterium]MDB6131462.1 two-component system response regulator [Verrucomicrobiales bacterium]
MNNVILLVDDSENDVVMLQRAAKNVGLTNPIYVVNSGKDALIYLQGEGKYADRIKYPSPGILLLDLKMPGIDGFEVLRWVRNQQRFKTLLVVVLSGMAETRDINRAYELGAHSYLIKPANPVDLANLMNFFQGYWTLANQQNGAVAAGVPLPTAPGVRPTTA